MFLELEAREHRRDSVSQTHLGVIHYERFGVKSDHQLVECGEGVTVVVEGTNVAHCSRTKFRARSSVSALGTIESAQGALRSNALLRTMARTRSGNKVAYVDPSAVP